MPDWLPSYLLGYLTDGRRDFSFIGHLSFCIKTLMWCHDYWRCRENNEHNLQLKDQTRDKWEIKGSDVTIYEELGHGAFGKVCKGIVQASSYKKRHQSTITVAVKMLQGICKMTLRHPAEKACSHTLFSEATSMTSQTNSSHLSLFVCRDRGKGHLRSLKIHWKLQQR